MADFLSINELKQTFPDVIVTKNGVETVDYQKLALILLDKLLDIEDQLNEKDYQILRITEQLDSIQKRFE